MKRILIILFITTFYSFSKGIADDQFNLGFESNVKNIPKWIYSNYNSSVEIDQKTSTEGHNSLKLSLNNISYADLTGAYAKLSQSFFIPTVKKKLEISIFSKGDRRWVSSLNIFCLNNLETVTIDKKIKLNLSDNWKKDSLIIETGDTKILSIEIEMKLNKEEIMKNAEIGFLWLDQLEIKIDDVDIHKLNTTISNNDLENQIKTDKISISTQTILDLSQITEIKNKKIIALGETIHGSGTINKIAFQTMQNQIEKGNVKLIMFEIPIDLAMFWNYYISRTEKISIEEYFPAGTLYDPIELKKFLDWLKHYNSLNNSKIAIIGIDMAGLCKEDNYLNRYIRLMKPSAEIDTISQYLRGFDTKSDQIAYAYLLNHWKLFASVIDNKQLIIFSQALKEIAGLINANSKLSETRDYVMSQNAIFGIDSLLKFKEKAIIYSHMGHISKICNRSIGNTDFPMGHYLNIKYGIDYYSIALLAAKGTFTARNDSVYTDKNWLEIPPSGSIEKVCMNLKDSCFFFSLNSNLSNNNLCFYRNSGAVYLCDQFFIGNINKRMDAIIFTENSLGFTIPKHWPLPKDMYWYSVKKFNENRKKEINRSTLNLP